MTCATSRRARAPADKADDDEWTLIDPAWEEGRLYAIVTGRYGLHNGRSYDVQVRAVTTADGAWSPTSTGTPADPGPSIETAAAIVNELPVRGWMSSRTEHDLYRFEVTGPREYFILTTGDTSTYGLLLDSSGKLVAGYEESDDLTASQNFKFGGWLGGCTDCSRTYYIEVTAASSPDSRRVPTRCTCKPLRTRRASATRR